MALAERLAAYRATKTAAPRCSSCDALLLLSHDGPVCADCTSKAAKLAETNSNNNAAGDDNLDDHATREHGRRASGPRTAAGRAAERRRHAAGASDNGTAAAAGSDASAPLPLRTRVAAWMVQPWLLGWRRETWVTVLFWALLLLLARELALVPFYVMFLLFYAMWATMEYNAHLRRPGTLSPYSVFNRNFERLEGTFDPSKFEKQLRQGRIM
jgi:hypothetical protein